MICGVVNLFYDGNTCNEGIRWILTFGWMSIYLLAR